MSSYAYFGTPICRQAAMQTYRVCKIAEDWKGMNCSVCTACWTQKTTLEALKLKEQAVDYTYRKIFER